MKRISLSRIRLCIFALTGFILLACHNLQAATIQVTSSGTTPAVDSAISFTIKIWEKYLISTQPIKINLIYADLTTAGPLGITFPNGRRDFAGAPLDSVWYPTSLANAITGTETNPGEADLDIYLNANSTIPWYFGTDGMPGASKYDFVSVLLHEIGHGLGFLSLAKSSSGSGSLGYLTAADFFPLSPSFPWPDLQGKPSVFDYFIESTAGDRIADTSLYANPSSSLHAAFTSNSLWWNAPKSFIANGNARIRIYAPTTFALGTSVTHLNETTFPSTHPSTLMSPFISKGEINHDPGLMTLAMLEDMGWGILYPVGTEDGLQPMMVQTFPNPFAENLHIQLPSDHASLKVDVMDLSGRVLRNWNAVDAGNQTTLMWDGRDQQGHPVTAGMYLLRICDESGVTVKKVVKGSAE